MHLIKPNRGGFSETFGTNLIWKNQDVYIMDNHRVAAWCWAEHTERNQPFSLFHIDRHYDLLQANLEKWVSAAPVLGEVNLQTYLDAEIIDRHLGPYKIFRWDNYLPIFIKQREGFMHQAFFMTHEEGDKPWFPFRSIASTESLECLDYWLSIDPKWIFNLDIDFFFMKSSIRDYRLFSDEYIEMLGIEWREAYDKNRFLCSTIALSPEMCGGWEAAESALSVFCKGAKLDPPEW